jgi:hypothetical protein
LGVDFAAADRSLREQNEAAIGTGEGEGDDPRLEAAQDGGERR